MTRPTITVDVRLPQDPSWRVEAMRQLRQAATQSYAELRVRTPRLPLTPAEHRVLAMDACGPYRPSRALGAS